MPGSVRRQREAELPSIRGRAAATLVRYVVRMTMLFSTLISAEPWKRTPRPPAGPPADAQGTGLVRLLPKSIQLARGCGDDAGFGEVVAPGFAHFERDGIRHEFGRGGRVRIGNGEALHAVLFDFVQE